MYIAGMQDDEVLTELAQSEHAWQTALDHRRNNEKLAMQYLWANCEKVRESRIVIETDFEELDVEDLTIPTKQVSSPLPPFPPTLLRNLPGMVGEMFEHMERGAKRSQPRLSLAGALAAVSAFSALSAESLRQPEISP